MNDEQRSKYSFGVKSIILLFVSSLIATFFSWLPLFVFGVSRGGTANSWWFFCPGIVLLLLLFLHFRAYAASVMKVRLILLLSGSVVSITALLLIWIGIVSWGSMDELADHNRENVQNNEYVGDGTKENLQLVREVLSQEGYTVKKLVTTEDLRALAGDWINAQSAEKFSISHVGESYYWNEEGMNSTYPLQVRSDRIEIELYSEKEKKQYQLGTNGEGKMFLLVTDKGPVFLGLGLIREYLVRP